ncbi:hypothetical protein EWF20_10890 [Sulfolobus sp. S-194]|uniref:hypothetical protein n=1 Tax=Sulfolobus sp. S-194 TaxID=2512240 RepID=UPI001436E8D9|nr:hypothetical protein [Sulfolobus sp. S-194]QIW24588.1 hypothetical protein EWF20_10890 [Sulfolobus sp. S-194]
MVNPLLYDFRRTFLRLSILILLILFVVGGVGIIYEAYHSLHIYPAELYNYNVIVTVNQNQASGIYHIIAFAFDNDGNPLSGVAIKIDNNTYVTNSSGYIVANTSTFPSLITANYDGEKKVVLSINTNIRNSVGFNSFGSNVQTSSLVENLFFNTIIFANITKLVDFSSFSYASQPFFMVFFVITGYDNNSAHFIFAGIGNFSVEFRSLNNSVIKSVNLSVNGIKDDVIQMPPNAFYIYVGVPKVSMSGTSMPLQPEIEFEIVTPMLGAMGLFSFAFIIVFIYVAYVMFGKLKDRGLDFILSRPITRGQLYFTRYFSGAISTLVASLLFSLTISLTSYSLLHFIPSFIAYYMFIYTFTIVLVWYSISYLFYSLLPPTSGLGISIALYFIVDIAISVISLLYPSLNNILSYYINPSSVSSLISYYMLYLQFPQGVNLGVSVISQLLWIVLPVLGGYVIFKRLNI